MDKQPFVYIMASKRNGTLYTGVTSDLVKRVWSTARAWVGAIGEDADESPGANGT